MKAVIRLDVPKFQIGSPVTVYFKDSMQQHSVCEADEIIRCEDCKQRDNWVIVDGCVGDKYWFCADGV